LGVVDWGVYGTLLGSAQNAHAERTCPAAQKVDQSSPTRPAAVAGHWNFMRRAPIVVPDWLIGLSHTLQVMWGKHAD
jgi:hypothetical protein